ncbi:unnamed protein product [Brassica rapa subsp. trilocularis]
MKSIKSLESSCSSGESYTTRPSYGPNQTRQISKAYGVDVSSPLHFH